MEGIENIQTSFMLNLTSRSLPEREMPATRSVFGTGQLVALIDNGKASMRSHPTMNHNNRIMFHAECNESVDCHKKNLCSVALLLRCIACCPEGFITTYANHYCMHA